MLRVDSTDQELGEAIKAAADAAEWHEWYEELPPPEVIERWERNIHEAAGVSSRAAFERNTQLAHVDRKANGWSVMPMRREHGAWYGLGRDALIQVPDEGGLDEVGQAVRRAFAVVLGN